MTKRDNINPNIILISAFGFLYNTNPKIDKANSITGIKIKRK